jgi:hypothetical protein
LAELSADPDHADGQHGDLHQPVRRGCVIVRGKPSAAAGVLALGLSLLTGCSGSVPGGPPESRAGQARVIAPATVEKAPPLRADEDYEVVSEAPAMVRKRRTHWRGMVSDSTVFGELAVPSKYPDQVPTTLVLLNTRSGHLTTVAELPAGVQLIGMDFSKTNIVWTETTSFSAVTEPWTLRSYDRRSGLLRTLATSDSLGVDEPPWLPPHGVVPRLSDGQVYVLAADGTDLPAKATAYRVPVDGSSGLLKVARDVQGVFPGAGDLTLIRHGQFFRKPSQGGGEKLIDPRHRGSQECPGAADSGVVVECDTYKGKPRLTILANGQVTEVRFPRPDPDSMNYGVGYLNCRSSWVTFSFNDKAYVLNLRTGRLGTLKGAQSTSSNPSWDETISYRKNESIKPTAEPDKYIRLLGKIIE